MDEQKYLIARGQLSEEHILVHALKRPVLDAPTVDAVSVVRCKDCVHRKIMRDPLRTPMDCFGCDIMLLLFYHILPIPSYFSFARREMLATTISFCNSGAFATWHYNRVVVYLWVNF